MSMETFASGLVAAIGIYLAFGFVFALYFVTRGVGAIDPVAREGTWGFRVLIMPGVTALWPLLIRRLLSGRKEPPTECNAHRGAAR